MPATSTTNLRLPQNATRCCRILRCEQWRLSAASPSRGRPKLRMRSSCLGHSIEHGPSDAVLDVFALKEPIQIVDDDPCHFDSNLAMASRNVRCENCSRQFAQRMANGQGLQGIGDVQSAPKASALYFLR